METLPESGAVTLEDGSMVFLMGNFFWRKPNGETYCGWQMRYDEITDAEGFRSFSRSSEARPTYDDLRAFAADARSKLNSRPVEF